MVTYERLQADRRGFLAFTGLTLPEFQLLLTAFPRAYQRLYPTNQTTEGQPRQRSAGGGCKGLLQRVGVHTPKADVQCTNPGPEPCETSRESPSGLCPTE